METKLRLVWCLVVLLGSASTGCGGSDAPAADGARESSDAQISGVDAATEADEPDADEETVADSTLPTRESDGGTNVPEEAGRDAGTAIDASSVRLDGGNATTDASHADLDAGEAGEAAVDGSSPSEHDAGLVPGNAVRVANVGGLTFDFCYRPHSTGTEPYTGPALRSLGLSGGLVNNEVSSYFPVLAPGDYDFILRPGGNSTPCTGTGRVVMVHIPDAAFVTLLVVAGGPNAQVYVFVDEHTVDPTKAKIRLLNGASTSGIEVGIGTGGSFMPLISGVLQSKVGQGTGVDANGYLELAPLVSQTFVGRIDGTTADFVVAPGITLLAGSVTTIFATLAPSPSSLFCDDLDNARRPRATCVVHP
jgi:hypothetical protein